MHFDIVHASAITHTEKVRAVPYGTYPCLLSPKENIFSFQDIQDYD
jgi:hypothetical protein